MRPNAEREFLALVRTPAGVPPGTRIDLVGFRNLHEMTDGEMIDLIDRLVSTQQLEARTEWKTPTGRLKRSAEFGRWVFTDIDRVNDALRRAKLPHWIESATGEAMVDHTGEPAVRVTFVVRAGSDDKVRNGAALSELTRMVRSTIIAEGVVLFPYMRFVGASEAA